MKAIFLIKIFTLFSLIFADDNTSPRKILIISDKTFDQTISKYQFTLVEFTTTKECHECSYYDNEFKSVFRYNKENSLFNLTFAKIDVSKNPQSHEKYNISSRLPELKLIKRDGFVIDFVGLEKKQGEVIDWLKKHLLPPYRELENVYDAQSFIRKNPNTLIFFGPKSANFDIFVGLNTDFVNVVFAQCETEDCYNHYKIKQGNLMMFKKHGSIEFIIDEKVLGNEEELREAISAKMIDNLIEFNNELADKIFNDRQPGLILYRNKTTSKGKHLEMIFEEVSRKLHGKIICAVSDMQKHLETSYGHFAGVSPLDLPTVRIVDPREEIRKYKLEKNITKENILEFYDNWVNQKLSLYHLSEKIPEKQKGKALKIVRDNYIETIMNSTMDVLVFYYKTHVPKCKELIPIYEDVARNLKKFNKNLIIAQIDSHFNELTEYAARRFPTIALFKIGQKESPVEFRSEEYTYSAIIDFLKNHLTNKLNLTKSDL